MKIGKRWLEMTVDTGVCSYKAVTVVIIRLIPQIATPAPFFLPSWPWADFAVLY